MEQISVVFHNKREKQWTQFNSIPKQVVAVSLFLLPSLFFHSSCSRKLFCLKQEEVRDVVNRVAKYDVNHWCTQDFMMCNMSTGNNLHIVVNPLLTIQSLCGMWVTLLSLMQWGDHAYCAYSPSAASLLLKKYHGGYVVIRLALAGHKQANRPFYRIVAAYNKRARDGKYIEQLGTYDPLPNIYNEKLVSFNFDRIKHWIGCGAHPTKPVAKLLGVYLSH